MIKNPPSNGGDGGSFPGQGTRIPHSCLRAICLSTTTTEFQCCKQEAGEPQQRPKIKINRQTLPGRVFSPAKKHPKLSREQNIIMYVKHLAPGLAQSIANKPQMRTRVISSSRQPRHSRSFHLTDKKNKLREGAQLATNSQGTSLVVLWLRIRLPTQRAWVWFLVRETKIPYSTGQLSPHAQLQSRPGLEPECCN